VKEIERESVSVFEGERKSVPSQKTQKNVLVCERDSVCVRKRKRARESTRVQPLKKTNRRCVGVRDSVGESVLERERKRKQAKERT